MVAGGLGWEGGGVVPDGRRVAAAFHFDSGTLTLTEAGTKKRASLHVVAGERELAQLDPGGMDVLSAGRGEVGAMVTSANQTLKRGLAEPHLFRGIGHSDSDGIFHEAALLPGVFALTKKTE